MMTSIYPAMSSLFGATAKPMTTGGMCIAFRRGRLRRDSQC
jgi:hypothetical protein